MHLPRRGGHGDAARRRRRATPAKATALIGGGEVLPPDEAAARVVAAVTEDRFLIFTHPEMQQYVERKAADPERWIRGMTRLWGRAQQLLAD